MSVQLTLHTAPEVPLEADMICPDRFRGLGRPDIEKLNVYHGNRTHPLADFFRVEGACDGEVHLHGDLSRVKHIAAGMTSGSVHVHGNIGAHLGAGMAGGRIVVDGDAGDWVAPEMRGGHVWIRGNAGHLIGSAYRGSPIGMTGGEIMIGGTVRNEIGHGMRNGLIAVGGGSGDFTGVNMLAGTIIVLGPLGIRTGAGMKRGTVVSLSPSELLPTFSYACTYRASFLPLYLIHLQKHGMAVEPEHVRGNFARWCGDAVEFNRGEILLYAP
ncbi:MAG: formylmethanofuran dehydrogenase subunit C [Gammaproteobacteria bacterium]